MRRILVSILLAAMCAGIGQAEEMTGEAAEKVKQEIIKIETSKVGTLLKGGSTAADWFDQNDDPSAIVVGADGSVDEKTSHVAKMRSNAIGATTLKQYGHRVKVFNNGNMAMVVYTIDAKLIGASHPVQGDTAVDVWVKENGKWQRVLHDVHRVMNLGKDATD